MSRFLTLFFPFFLVGVCFSGEAVDFSRYRLGKNNRTLLEAIISELTAEFGVPVTTAYRKSLQATPHQIIIDEAQLDNYLREHQDSKEQEAIARFTLAHEYFHVLLKHPQARDSIRTPREIQIKGTYSQARKEMEKQVDYLAAKYLNKLSLPIRPVQELFLRHPEFHGGELYPSAQERAEIVLLGQNKGIEEKHFDNDVIQCVSLLEELRIKLP